MEHAARQNSNYLFCRVFIDLWGWPLLFEITSLLSTTLDWFMKLIRCDTTNQNQEEQLVRKRPSAIFLWVWCWLHLTRIKEDSHLHVYHCDNSLDYSSSALDFITAVSCDKTALKNIYSRVKTKKKNLIRFVINVSRFTIMSLTEAWFLLLTKIQPVIMRLVHILKAN